jgi:hypothetical protein
VCDECIYFETFVVDTLGLNLTEVKLKIFQYFCHFFIPLRNIFIFTFEVKLKNGIATFEAKKEREIFFHRTALCWHQQTLK